MENCLFEHLKPYNAKFHFKNLGWLKMFMKAVKSFVCYQFISNHFLNKNARYQYTWIYFLLYLEREKKKFGYPEGNIEVKY